MMLLLNSSSRVPMESTALSSVEFHQLKKAHQCSEEAEFPQQSSTEDPVVQPQQSEEAEFPQPPVGDHIFYFVTDSDCSVELEPVPVSKEL